MPNVPPPNVPPPAVRPPPNVAPPSVPPPSVLSPPNIAARGPPIARGPPPVLPPNVPTAPNVVPPQQRVVPGPPRLTPGPGVSIQSPPRVGPAPPSIVGGASPSLLAPSLFGGGGSAIVPTPPSLVGAPKPPVIGGTSWTPAAGPGVVPGWRGVAPSTSGGVPVPPVLAPPIPNPSSAAAGAPAGGANASRSSTDDEVNDDDSDESSGSSRGDSVRQDRYGFELSGVEPNEAERRLQQRESELEMEMEKKWVQMMGEWRAFVTKSPDKLELRVRKGIPDCCRSRAWQFILDLDWDNQGNQRRGVDDIINVAPPRYAEAIDRDIAQTLPTMVLLRDAARRESVRRILLAYANTDPELGYSSGMAWPAAMLVCYLDETRAFWCFVKLMCGTKFSFRRLFMNGFEGFRMLNQIWMLLLAEKAKRVAAKFEAIQLAPELYTKGWFLCAFQDINLDPELRLRLFDRYIAFGCRSLLSFGLVIVSAASNELISGTAEQCIALLERPDTCSCWKNWRTMLGRFDKMWLAQKDYERLFRKADLPFFQ